MAAKQSERIKLWGLVQGVGFRPYVAKIADKFNMKGQVMNIGGLVEITVTDTPLRISSFIDELVRSKPAPAEIVHIKREPIKYCDFDTFTIIKSDRGDNEAAMLPADLAICPDCLRELYTKTDPRYQHPFISCMICGPRYTIIDKIPYDRENTAMMDFSMCSFCKNQYTDLHDRRYHAQTISCHNCGPQLLWKENPNASDTVISNLEGDSEILDNASKILKNGGIIAFKSVGGYNLLADPFNDKATAKLRHIKNRESKPFAVMFRDVDQVKNYCSIDDIEEKLLNSSARPIILLEHKELPYEEIKKSRFIGSFLPSFAAQYILLDRISPLIFTSANISDMPMIKDEGEMIEMMNENPLIDGMIYNARQIRVRADDSVVRVIDGQPQMIRRSKGYAPVPLYIDISDTKNNNNDFAINFHQNHPDTNSSPVSDSNIAKKLKNVKNSTDPLMILASGSQLKNSFAVTKENFVYMSQFFGDMDTVENQNLYSENIDRFCGLFRIKPNAVVCDMHPLYYTTGFAENYAKTYNLPLIRVQHHHAHVASVMAENNLSQPVIGISFDGTGYGTDGCIWGGEIFICHKSKAKRIAHLKYVDMIGGDSSVRDARRSAISYIHAYDNGYLKNNPSVEGHCKDITIDISDIISFGRKSLLDQPDSKLITAALNSGVNTVRSSSMGRLFDGVSALLGIKNHNDYEGQCAVMLEDAASFAKKHPRVDTVSDLALQFHNKVIDAIVNQCIATRKKYGLSQIVLTGGTFQNKILMEGVLEKLRDCGFIPYYNISVSPNDGGIALGQAYVAMHEIQDLLKK